VREGGFILLWWLTVAVLGWTAFPLCARLLAGLPDRGYGLAKSVGLLLVAFVFWTLTIMGLTANSTGGMVLAWLIVLTLSVSAYRAGERVDWRAYWRENRALILATEALFIALFVGWAVFRAYQNDTVSTEKPMDLMFISSIMRSESFPPQDAWLSGYAVSYYHFGYLMVASLGKLTGANSGITFSLALALCFALAGVNAFSVGYALVRSPSNRRDAPLADDDPRKVRRVGEAGGRISALMVGALAAFMLVWMSNAQFVAIEMPYQAGLGDEGYYRFWGVQERSSAPLRSADVQRLTDASGWDYWWWFRASRVLTDYNLDGTPIGIQPIDEFPNFSFLLGDVHPHVFALPFGMMALGLALNVLLALRPLSVWQLLFYGVTVGSLIFLNTWDVLAYWGALIGADALRRVMKHRGQLPLAELAGVAVNALFFAGVALVAYAPFLYSFRSQAAGIVPNALFPTYVTHFFLMFAPFIVVLGVWLVRDTADGAGRMNWRLAGASVGVVVLALAGIMLVGLLVYNSDPALRQSVQSFVDDVGGWNSALGLWLGRRLAGLPTLLLVAGVMAFVVARLFAKSKTLVTDAGDVVHLADVPYRPAHGFALLLVAVGATLVLIPEFVYLRDNFETRINTIFKFYYQVWGVWSIAGAYAVYAVLSTSKGFRRGVLAGGFAVVLALSGLYGVYGVWWRANVEGRTPNAPLTMDGRAKMTLTPDDYRTVQCLEAFIGTERAVVAEAVRDAYRSYYGRVASISGVPIVMGWENHQRQWRGATFNAVAGGRASDIDALYNTLRWEVAVDILKRYNIGYIMMGQTERNQYAQVGEEKFIENLSVICEHGTSRVYRVTERALSNPFGG
jgi:YYY domain-containing protein